MPYPLAAFNSQVKSSFWEARKSGIQDAKSIDLKVLFYFFIYYKLIITIMVEGDSNLDSSHKEKQATPLSYNALIRPQALI